MTIYIASRTGRHDTDPLMPQLPPLDFMVIGAAKSATGWLANCLADHPQVFLPRAEIHYFSRHFDEKGANWYAGKFKNHGDEPVIGERSNSYLSDAAAPERIAAAYPQIKLIAALRQPVDRAYSHYCMDLRWGRVDPDVGKYLDPSGAVTRKFLDGGMYATQLDRYLSLFPREQLHLILQDDVREDPAEVLVGVCRFLGVSTQFHTALLTEKFHSKDSPTVFPLLRKAALSNALSQWMVEMVRRNGFYRRCVRPWISRKQHYPPLPHELRSRLLSYYEPQVIRLSQMLGRPLDGWLSSRPKHGAPTESSS